jgi:Fe-S cluster assembly protein SufD
MTAVTAAKESFLAGYDRGKERGSVDAPWLRRMREEAFGRFMERGFPTTKEEDWKYTDVAAIGQGLFKPAAVIHSEIREEAIGRLVPGSLDRHLVVFVNGSYSPGLSRLHPLPAGVQIGGLSAALRDDPDRVEPYFARFVGRRGNGFVDLNTALMEDGAFIQLSRGTAIPDPIHLLFVTSAGDQAVMTHPRILVAAEEGTRATVVEHYVNLGAGTYLTNTMTEIAAGRNAAITHYKIQEEGPDAYHIATVRAYQGASSRFTSHSASFGGVLSRNDVDVALGGEGAECVLDGLYLGDGCQHVDTHTSIDHLKPRGTSRVFFGGILNGRARGVFGGKVVVHKDAQKTDARQTIKNLLLSREAEADSRPQMEIYADDVKCSHGATVGQLEEEKIFYLRSRGVDEAFARNLLTYAFASEALDRFEIPPIRRGLETKLMAWLPEGQRIKEFHDETGK